MPPQTYKDFRVQKAIDCQPENATYPVKATNMKTIYANDTMFMSGTFEVLHELPMNMELELTLTRCNIDGSGCFLFDKIIFSRICEKMLTKTSVASKIITGIHPVPHCPIAVGFYYMMNDATFSIDMFKMLPLEGYLWRARYTFYEKRSAKRVRALACLELDVIVVTVSHRTKPKRQ